MKLLQEADLDDRFNSELGKIQDSITVLQKLVKEYGKDKLSYPLNNQIIGVEIAAEDLTRIKDAMNTAKDRHDR